MTLRDVAALLQSLVHHSVMDYTIMTGGMLLCDAQGCWCAVAEFSASLRDGLRHHDRRGCGPHGEGGRDGHAQSL